MYTLCISSVSVFILVLVQTSQDAQADVKLGKDNFEEETKTGVAFVKFFAPGCVHCSKLASVWEELAQLYKGDHNWVYLTLSCNQDILETAQVTIASADCTNIASHNPLLCSAQGVKSFPTLNIYRDGMLDSQYRGKRELRQPQWKTTGQSLSPQFPGFLL